jgi:hypothetical protein
VLSGDNVVFRNFAYVELTNRNRRSFIRHVRETYRNFDPNEGEKRRLEDRVEITGLLSETTIESLHQFFCLICPDYPIDYIRSAHRILLMPRPESPIDNFTSNSAPFETLMTYSFLFLYFSKFVMICARRFAEHGESDEAAVTKARIFQQIISDVDAYPALAVPDRSILIDVLCSSPGISLPPL